MMIRNIEICTWVGGIRKLQKRHSILYVLLS